MNSSRRCRPAPKAAVRSVAGRDPKGSRPCFLVLQYDIVMANTAQSERPSYEAPTIEWTDVVCEAGFAQSGGLIDDLDWEDSDAF